MAPFRFSQRVRCFFATPKGLCYVALHAIMHRMHNYGEIGLRERKRAATYRAIEEAAVEIALEHGYEATTAEAIAARANVSLRTLFNYFPSKDLAIAGRGIGVIDAERARTLLRECEPNLLKGIARVIAAGATDMDLNSDLMLRRRDLIFQNPPLLHQHLMAIREAEIKLTRIIVDYLREEPPQRHLLGKVTVEEEARLAMTVAGAAIRYSMDMWLENDLDTFAPSEMIERTLSLMAQIHKKDS
jgi:AcrR family transcriptional regulator